MIALYRAATIVLYPLIVLWLRVRLKRGKEHPARFPERLGRAALPRPGGRLVWLHGASVGESMALLPLAKRLKERMADATILLTSGTVTSAELLATRMPEGFVHQFAPVDALPAVRRFLSHWQPDLAVWVESELWPNLILETRRRGTAMTLVSGRLSESSYRNWKRFPQTAATLLQAFRLIAPQRAEDGIRFAALEGRNLLAPLNLKLAGDALPVNAENVAQLQAAIGKRPVWLAASTHAGEEAIVARVHKTLQAEFPGLLTLIAPRHPNRADAIAALLRDEGLATARRSTGEPIIPETAVYLADTLGELGTLFAVCRIVFVGGSFVPVGGHNPLEPARSGCTILHGPLFESFSDIYTVMDAQEAARCVADEAALTTALRTLLKHTSDASALARNASAYAAQGAKGLDALVERLVQETPHVANP